MEIKITKGEVLKIDSENYKVDFGHTDQGGKINFDIIVEKGVVGVKTSCGCTVPEIKDNKISVEFSPRNLGINVQIVTITDKKYNQTKVEIKTYVR